MIEYTKVPKVSGSSIQTINISKDGKSYGQMWTWPNTKNETHPWHVKLLNNTHNISYAMPKAKSLKQLKTWVEA